MVFLSTEITGYQSGVRSNGIRDRHDRACPGHPRLGCGTKYPQRPMLCAGCAATISGNPDRAQMRTPTNTLRNWNASDILRHLVALLHGRPLRNCYIPALDRGVFVEVDRLPFEARDPWPDCDVGDGIVAGYKLAVCEPPVEHAIQAMRLLEIALLGVGRLALVVFHEMVDLPEHRSRPAHLPHQPFQHAVAWLALLRQQLACLVREIDHQRTRLHQADPGVAVDDGRNAIVGADLEKLRFELLVLADVDGMRGIRQADLLQHDGCLAAVRGGPGVKIDHGWPFGACNGCSPECTFYRLWPMSTTSTSTDRSCPLRVTCSVTRLPTPMRSSSSVRSGSRWTGLPPAATITSAIRPPLASAPLSPARSAGEPGVVATTATPSTPARVAAASFAATIPIPGVGT